jgi:prepilin-type N-terminal cleavage/methylation domain-containing protein
MSNRSHIVGQRFAFTLIELLVVVAIIAVLIAILLPALAAARQQGKVTVCLSNLRTLGTAATSYRLEFDDLPWCLPSPYVVDGRAFSYPCISSFIYAGGIPDKTSADWRETGIPGPAPTGCDVYRVPPRYRPMNRYVAPEVTWDREIADRTTYTADIPGFFKCPSDSTAAVTLLGSRNPELEHNTNFPTWAFWGTSYPMNWAWAYYFWHPVAARGTHLGMDPPYSRDLGTILGGRPRVAQGLGTYIFRKTASHFESTFVLIFENKLGYALEGALPRGLNNEQSRSFLGWHNQIDYHSALFLDAHAKYSKYDTRYVDGTGWTIWPARPWEDDWAQYSDQ